MGLINVEDRSGILSLDKGDFKLSTQVPLSLVLTVSQSNACTLPQTTTTSGSS